MSEEQEMVVVTLFMPQAHVEALIEEACRLDVEAYPRLYCLALDVWRWSLPAEMRTLVERGMVAELLAGEGDDV